MNQDETIVVHGCGHSTCRPCTLKGYESNEIDYVCGYLDKLYKADKLTGTFIDVGAHVGLWSVSLSEWYRAVYNIKPLIYALEPEALNYRALLKNAVADENSGIVPIQVAAWHINEMLFLNKPENPSQCSVNNVGLHSRDAVRVRGIKLDDAAKSPEAKNIDVIKIDVEGAELNVMNGARELLMSNEQLLVVVEYSLEQYRNYGYRPMQLTNFMKEHGYRQARPEDIKVTSSIRAGEIKRVMWVKGEII